MRYLRRYLHYFPAITMELIHPRPDPENESWLPGIDMANATLSNDNLFIVVGDQCSDHRILDQAGEVIVSIGPQSSYPHYCLFPRMTNS